MDCVCVCIRIWIWMCIWVAFLFGNYWASILCIYLKMISALPVQSPSSSLRVFESSSFPIQHFLFFWEVRSRCGSESSCEQHLLLIWQRVWTNYAATTAIVAKQQPLSQLPFLTLWNQLWRLRHSIPIEAACHSHSIHARRLLHHFSSFSPRVHLHLPLPLHLYFFRFCHALLARNVRRQ